MTIDLVLAFFTVNLLYRGWCCPCCKSLRRMNKQWNMTLATRVCKYTYIMIAKQKAKKEFPRRMPKEHNFLEFISNNDSSSPWKEFNFLLIFIFYEFCGNKTVFRILKIPWFSLHIINMFIVFFNKISFIFFT